MWSCSPTWMLKMMSLYVLCSTPFFWLAGATSTVLLRKETKANIEPNYGEPGKQELENGIGFLPVASYLQVEVPQSHEIMQHTGENAKENTQSKVATARAIGQSQQTWFGKSSSSSADPAPAPAPSGDGNALEKLKSILGCKVGLMFGDQVQTASEALQNMSRNFEKVADASSAFAEHARSLETKAEEFLEKAKAKSLEGNATDSMQKVVDLATQAANTTASTARAAGEAAESLHHAVEKATRLADEFAKNASEAIQKAMDMCPKLPTGEALLMESRARMSGKSVPAIVAKLKAAACNAAQVVSVIAQRLSAGFEKTAALAQNISEKADEKASIAGNYADAAVEAAEILSVHAEGDLSENAARMFTKASEAASKAATVLRGLQIAAMSVSQTAEAIEIANGPVQENAEKLVQAAETLCADAGGS